MHDQPENTIKSPCISECRLGEDDICQGCYRVRSEIIGWANKPDSEKIDIIQRCEARRNTVR